MRTSTEGARVAMSTRLSASTSQAQALITEAVRGVLFTTPTSPKMAPGPSVPASKNLRAVPRLTLGAVTITLSSPCGDTCCQAHARGTRIMHIILAKSAFRPYATMDGFTPFSPTHRHCTPLRASDLSHNVEHVRGLSLCEEHAPRCKLARLRNFCHTFELSAIAVLESLRVSQEICARGWHI